MAYLIKHHSNGGVFFGDDFYKLLKADPSVSVFVGVLNHLFDLNRGKPFSHAFTNFSKLFNPEGTHSVFVKNLEELLQIGGGLVISVESEYFQKSLEIHF